VIPLDEIRGAVETTRGTVVRTPLVRLRAPEVESEIWLKLENLQPIGSFKLRGAYHAITTAPPDEVRHGVLTASAGNMGQGVAWAARQLGLPCTVVVPDTAPQTKLDAMERLGATIVKVAHPRWWQAMVESRFDDVPGVFVHPVENERMMAGNGTIGLELLEDLPDLDVVLVPFGGGGLSVGIASAVKALRPEARVYAVEPANGAPLTASFAAGEMTQVEDYRPSFVDGAGAPRLLPKMWGLAREALDGAFSVSVDDAAAGVRLLADRARIVAEGAGALATAAALAGQPGDARKVVAIVSGGNIDAAKLASILEGSTP
jgi:threonine dehydratase